MLPVSWTVNIESNPVTLTTSGKGVFALPSDLNREKASHRAPCAPNASNPPPPVAAMSKNVPVGSQSTPRAQTSWAPQLVALLALRLVGSFQELTVAPPPLLTSSTATARWVAPPTVVKLPMITAWLCCGLIAACRTWVAASVFCCPEMESWLPCSAPLAGLTNASTFCAVPATREKFPASHSDPPTRLRLYTTQGPPPSHTCALNEVSEPLVVIAATPLRLVPAAPGAGANWVKAPATYTVVEFPARPLTAESV